VYALAASSLLAVLLSDDFELSVAAWLTGAEDVTLEISMGTVPVTARMLQLHCPTGHESDR
jgi:hypothetical protein